MQRANRFGYTTLRNLASGLHPTNFARKKKLVGNRAH
jgi:hypothetical protein